MWQNSCHNLVTLSHLRLKLTSNFLIWNRFVEQTHMLSCSFKSYWIGKKSLLEFFSYFNVRNLLCLYGWDSRALIIQLMKISWRIIRSNSNEETDWKGSLSTVDLLVKVACFVEKLKYVCSIKISCGLYYKPVAIINDDSRVVNKLETSLTDDARVIIYDSHMFIVQATDLNPLVQGGQPYWAISFSKGFPGRK